VQSAISTTTAFGHAATPFVLSRSSREAPLYDAMMLNLRRLR
jgi:hypothetical protein